MEQKIITNEEYKNILKSDLIICENALLNYPKKEKMIKKLMKDLNQKLEVLK